MSYAIRALDYQHPAALSPATNEEIEKGWGRMEEKEKRWESKERQEEKLRGKDQGVWYGRAEALYERRE